MPHTISVIAIVLILIVIAWLAVWCHNTYNTHKTLNVTRTASGALSTDPVNSELILTWPINPTDNLGEGIAVLPNRETIYKRTQPYIYDVLNNINTFAAANGQPEYRLATVSDLNAAQAAGFNFDITYGWALDDDSNIFKVYKIGTSGVDILYQGKDVYGRCSADQSNIGLCCGTGMCTNGDYIGMFVVGVKPPQGSYPDNMDATGWSYTNGIWSYYSN